MKRGLQHTRSVPGHLIGKEIPVITVDMECPDCEGAGLVVKYHAAALNTVRYPDICHCVQVETKKVL